MLPKTASEISNGGVYAQSVRCGKSNCKCAKGDLHTGHYFFTRVAGKFIKVYVPKTQIMEISGLVGASRIRRAENRSIKLLNRESVRKMSDLLRNLKVQINELGSEVN